MVTHYFTASSLDGFIATTEHSLDWLLKQDVDAEGPMAYQEFEKSIGALAMGASTYEWVLEHEAGRWGYQQPAWVFTHRRLPIPAGADVTLTHGAIADVHAAMTAAAGGKDLWVIGGGAGRPVRRCGASR